VNAAQDIEFARGETLINRDVIRVGSVSAMIRLFLHYADSQSTALPPQAETKG
jgi:hypothetical protein